MAREDNPNQILREEAFSKQDIIDFIMGGGAAGGTNLVQPRTFEYGSYQIPASDPTYTSGFDYARTIAGGMPFEDVVAPGMSFSPDRPMGYTQQDLNFISSGPVPVMPPAPTKDEPLVMEDQMPYAPPGTPEPTIFGQQPTQEVANLFQDIDREGLSEKLKNLNLFNFEDADLSNLPDYNLVNDRFKPSPDPRYANLYEYLNRPLDEVVLTTMPVGPGISFEGNIDSSFPITSDIGLTMPSAPQSGGVQRPSTTVGQTIGDIRDTYTPEQVAQLQRRERERQAQEEANIIAKYGSRENLQNQIDAALGTNLVMPINVEPRIPVKQPPLVIPNIPVFTPPPVPSLFAEPRVNIDDIVSPISAGRITRRMPNLFNIV